jgi:hypothetical protein
MADAYVNLFGEPIAIPAAAIKGAKKRRRATVPRGYASPPGTGPAGETCQSCEHIVRSRRYRKCGLMRARWTHGPGTDILARSPACKSWAAAT